jgi:acetolactate synthase-1/3 small subunit
MRHIISILLENEAGALSRVSGLFSARAYNIESLTVAPTDDDSISRITVVAYGEDAVVEQILKQLNKLVDVIRLVDLTEDEHFEREIMLIKVSPKDSHQSELAALIKDIQAQILAVNDNVTTLEIIDTCSNLNAALDKLSSFNVIEVVRSGAVGISSSAATLKI